MLTHDVLPSKVWEKSAKSIKKNGFLPSKYDYGLDKKHLVGTTNSRTHGKGLKGNRVEEWWYRIGDYRLIVHINDKKITILILELGHRRDIYK